MATKKRKILYAIPYKTGNGDWGYIITDNEIKKYEMLDVIVAYEEGLIDDDDFYELEDICEFEILSFAADTPPKFITGCKSESCDYYFDLTDEVIKKNKDVIEKVIRPYMHEEADYICDVHYWPYSKDVHVWTKKEISELSKKYKAWLKKVDEE